MENLSLFDQISLDGSHQSSPVSAKLDVVKMKFAGVDTLRWSELFSGYDSLHAITYSSGIGFVCQLLDLFQQAEIIFGCDEVISYSLQEVMAFQTKTLERMRETAGKMKLDLISRIEENSLRFYMARSVLSHEKLYLLSAQDGRKRVVTGSANMSFSAFGGGQRENICYLNGDAAYDWYMACYCALRESSTDEIVKKNPTRCGFGRKSGGAPHLQNRSDSKGPCIGACGRKEGRSPFCAGCQKLGHKTCLRCSKAG